MKNIFRFVFLGLFFVNVSVLAAEGPFISDGVPWARVSVNGNFVIYRMPASAECYGNKIGVDNSEDPDMRKMALSMVTAAQMSEKKIKVWVNYFDSTTPQRCKLAFMEIEQ